MFGKPFSHPFIVFKSPSDLVISEVHGSWKRGSVLETRLAQIFDKVSGKLRSEFMNSCMAGAARDYYPQGFIMNTRGPRQYDSRVEEHLLFKGPQQKARAMWMEIVGSFPTLNEQKKPYYRYAEAESAFTNCQTLIRQSLHTVETVLPRPLPALKLAETGWTPPRKTDINFNL